MSNPTVANASNTQQNSLTILDVEALMNSTLDAVPDAPDFLAPPPGLYVLAVQKAKIESGKDKKEKPYTRIRVTHNVVQTVECQEAPVPDGSMFSETFQATEEGLGYFKNRAKAILGVTDLAGVPISTILQELEGKSFNAKLTIKLTPNPTGGNYENVQIRVIPAAA